jgi:transcription antitermination factor NusG
MIERAPIKAPWYALRVQQRLARAVSISLRGKGYEEFFPLCHPRADLTGAVNGKEQDIPLFPGYLFCRFDIRDRLLPILTTPGVMSIVGIGKTPAPVSDEEIDSIKAVIRSGLRSQTEPFLPTGSKVFIERGPLAGVQGVVIGPHGNHRLIVSVMLLQRSVSVEVDPNWISSAAAIDSLMPEINKIPMLTSREYRA